MQKEKAIVIGKGNNFTKEIDLESAQQWQEEIHLELNQIGAIQGREVCVSLEEIKFMDSHGIKALKGVMNFVVENQGDVRLLEPQDKNVKNLLEKINLAQF